jgi:hypothetical protein
MIEVEGMEFKVLMGTDPAEVEEWRNQRRRKFPTEANIKQQEKDRTDLLSAGGLERNNNSNGSSKQLRGKNEPKRSREGREAPSEDGSDQKRAKVSPVSSSVDLQSQNLSLSLVQDYVSNDSAEEQDDATGTLEATHQPRRQAAVCRAHLSGKCRRGDKCRYSHSSGEGGTSTTSLQPCSYFLKGKCRRGSKCMFSHTLPVAAPAVEGGAPISATAAAVVPSLYRKLIASEVDSEENVLLQCIRYLVQENFLES